MENQRDKRNSFLEASPQRRSSEPLGLCQVLKIGLSKAATKVKYFTASATASPEFCMPTSIASVQRTHFPGP